MPDTDTEKYREVPPYLTSAAQALYLSLSDYVLADECVVPDDLGMACRHCTGLHALDRAILEVPAPLDPAQRIVRVVESILTRLEVLTREATRLRALGQSQEALARERVSAELVAVRWLLTGKHSFEEDRVQFPNITYVVESFDCKLLSKETGGEEQGPPVKVAYFVGKAGDEATGTFPVVLTPQFEDVNVLEEFCREHREQYRQMLDSEPRPNPFWNPFWVPGSAEDANLTVAETDEQEKQ